MALPNSNISVSMVKAELGAATNDVGQLCIHPNVNKWSRWKPVANPKIGNMTASDYAAVYTGVEVSNNGNYGLTIPDVVRTTSINSVPAAIEDACANSWEYRKPMGGVNEPFRLGDFRNYYHQAVPPIQCTAPALTILGATENRLSIYFDLDPGDSTYNLQAYDLYNNGSIDLSNCTLFGILKDYRGDIISMNESETILDSSGELNAPAIIFSGFLALPQMNPGYEYQIYIVIRNLNYTAGWEFLPLPDGFGYNQFPLLVNINRDMVEDGGGVVIAEQNIWFSPAFGQPYRTANDCMEDYSATWKMRNTTGDLLVRIDLKNGSMYSKTFAKNDFDLLNYYNDTQAYPQYMFTSEPSGASGGVTQVTLAAGETKSIWFYYQAPILNTPSPEIVIRRGQIELITGTLMYSPGSVGWQEA